MRKNIFLTLIMSVFSILASFAAEVKSDVFTLTQNDSAVEVVSGGTTFIIPKKNANGALIRICDGIRRDCPVSTILMLGEGDFKGYARIDGRNAGVSILENSDMKKLFRAEFSLSEAIRDKTGKALEAKLIVYYGFVRNVPGVFITERICGPKELSLFKFNIVTSYSHDKQSVDSTDLKAFPTAEEKKKNKGRTNAKSYLLATCKRTGSKFYYSSDFLVYLNDGFFIHPRHHLSSTGLNIPTGDVQEHSYVIGKPRNDADISALNTMRQMIGAIPAEGSKKSSATAVLMKDQMFATALKKKANGNFQDWDQLPVIIRRDQPADYRPRAGLNWNGPKDLSFVFKAAYDSDYLYVYIDVTDDKFVNNFTGGSLWNGDSVQFGIDPLCAKDAKAEINFGISAVGKRPAMWCWANPNKKYMGDLKNVIKNNTKIRKGGIVYNIAIPWDFLKPFDLTRGKMGFNFAVIDQDDGTNYENWMGITDGIFAGKDFSKFYDLNFKSIESIMIEREKTPAPKSVFPHAVIIDGDTLTFNSFVVIANEKLLPADLEISFSGKRKFSKPLKRGFNSFTFTLEKGDLELGRWQVETAVVQNGKKAFASKEEIAILNADYLHELNRKLAEKIKGLDAKGKALRDAGKNPSDYFAFTEMLRFFNTFIKEDVNAKQVHASGGRLIPVDGERRRYIFKRAFLNLQEGFELADSLSVKADRILAGKEKIFTLPPFEKGVQPVIADGGFKVNGKELMLFGPQTLTNVRGSRDEDIPWFSKTGMNFFSNFYVGEPRRTNLAKMAESENLYFCYGASTATLFNQDTIKDPFYQSRIKNQGHYLSPLPHVSPNMVYIITQAEQFPRKYEMTDAWAKEFQTHLKGKFGSIEKLNETLGTQFKDFSEINFNQAVRIPNLKYESFLYRRDLAFSRQKVDDAFKRQYFKRVTSTHYSSVYNITGLDPLITLCDFEGLWGIFDVIGFDGGIAINGSGYALNFSIGTIDCDLARSYYPDKPIANNEDHIFDEAMYEEYSFDQVYTSHILAHLHGQNASLIWVWAYHPDGEYAFTRVNTYKAAATVGMHLQKYAEEIASFRKENNPPFRILRGIPALIDRDVYIKSLYNVYEGCYFSGWQTRFLSDRMLEKGDFQGVKVVVVPNAERMYQKTFDALVKFADNGGKVLVFGEKAMTKNEYGKVIPGRESGLAKFIRKDVSGPVQYAETLNALLDSLKIEPPLKITGPDGKIPFGVEYRTGKGKDGKDLLYILNLSRKPMEVSIPGKWHDIIEDKDFPSRLTLRSLEFHLLRRK